MRLSGQVVGILVLVAIVVLPLHMALAQQVNPVTPARTVLAKVAGGLNPYNVTPTRTLPDTVEQGEIFDVTVNFTSPADKFHCVVLVDIAPDGWNVAGDPAWCTPSPDLYNLSGNVISMQWTGESPYWFNETDPFIARYQVTVPCNASVGGNHSFNLSTPKDVYVDYYVEYSDLCTAPIIGDYNVTVIAPTINFTPQSIHFYGAVNGTNPQNQTLELWSSTSCLLNWSLTDDAWDGTPPYDWLSVPENGSCTDVHSSATLSVNSSGMPGGQYFANITIEAPEANNTQEIVPVTLHMSETDILKVHVSFAGRSSPPCDAWIEQFEVIGFTPNTTTVAWNTTAITNNTGWFNISDVFVGIYDIGIKNCTCLSELVTNVTVSEGTGGVVGFGPMREGDIDNDDWVWVADLSKLGIAWNTKPGAGNWNPYADLNRDGWVWVSDLSLFGANWNHKGDAYGHF